MVVSDQQVKIKIMGRINKTLTIKDVLFDMLIKIVDKNPNDKELGFEVRKFINEWKNKIS